MSALDNYTLGGEWQVPLTGNPGTLSVVNLNLGVTVTLAVHHRTYGSETIELTQSGATVSIPLDGIDAVTITASSYPATILYLNTAVPMQLSTPQTFAGSSGGGATVNVEPVGLSGAIRSSVVTVGALAVALPAATLANRRTLTVQAAPDNTAVLYLGGSDVTANETATGGLQLAAGASVAMDVGGAVLYAISTVAGQKAIVIEGS